MDPECKLAQASQMEVANKEARAQGLEGEMRTLKELQETLQITAASSTALSAERCDMSCGLACN